MGKAMALARGPDALGRLVEVLGVQNQHVQRVVLVFDVRGGVEVYVKRLAQEEEVDGVADLLAGLRGPAPPSDLSHRCELAQAGAVEVDERGRVWVPGADLRLLAGQARAVLRLLEAGLDARARGDAVRMLRLALGEPLPAAPAGGPPTG